MDTKEDLRKAAVQAVAQRIAAGRAAKKNAVPAPPPSIFKPKAPTEPLDVPSGTGRITISPTAVLTFGKQQDDLTFASASTLTFQQLVLGDTDHGQVEFKIPVTWKFPPIHEKNSAAAQALEGKGLAQFIVPFTISSDKPEQPSIAWQSPRTVTLSSDGGGATLTVASPPISTDTTSDGGAATITPTIQFQEQVALADAKAGDTVSGGGGWTIPIIGVGVSGQVTHDVGKGHQEQTQTTITDSYSVSFTAKVVLPKPETVDPSAAPPLVVLFAVDSDATASDEDAITRWYKGLDKKLRDSIEAGKTPVNLLGKASATGSLEHNRQLAHRRAGKVRDILADLAGSDCRFHVQAPGKSQATRQGEASSERVVEVTVGDDRPQTD
jgi:outer membrane protein OmpA-like peptidoglycan-associated protein